ncbi:MAG: iron-containing redox enzyme family protein [Methylobacter sp.]
MNTPSKHLSTKLDLAYPTLSAHAQRIWDSPNVRELYPIYLRTMHMIVRSAVPLMQAAIVQARARGSADKLATGLISYLTRHIKEESGHDIWLLEDLEATGADQRVTLNCIPPPHVAMLVGAQYYWLRHHHPISLLGHITALESYHPPAGFAKRLSNLTGYPIEAFRAISRHETLDVFHKRELYEVIDELPLKREHEKMMTISGLHTLQAGIDVLTDIYTSVPHT